MKFAHLSDIHIGSWREPKIRELNLQAFVLALELCMAERVEFILIAGDLFNTALPAIEKLAIVAQKLKEIKDAGIPTYVIAGSHDFSPSGKTMIDVLENAGLFVNVCKGKVVDQKLRLMFTTDAMTGVKITGMVGKRGMLDRIYYEDLDREALENECGKKIFMFHTALTELKPKHLEQMEAAPVSLLPRGFFYYAGGHVHHRMEYSGEGYRIVAQPGALFPNNFAELEKYGHGGFYIIDDAWWRWVPVKLKDVISIELACDGKDAGQVAELCVNALGGKQLQDAIITLRLFGKMRGKVSEIMFTEIVDKFYSRGAYFVMKNTAALKGEEFEEIEVRHESIEDIEDAVIREHAGQISLECMDKEREIMLVKELMHALCTEKKEGETVKDFDERVKKAGMLVLGV